MSTSKSDNTERNARILVLARQGKTEAEIARALGLSRRVVSGVLQRAREAQTWWAQPMSPPASEGRRPDRVGAKEGQEVGGEMACSPGDPPIPQKLTRAADIALLWRIVCQVYRMLRAELRGKGGWPSEPGDTLTKNGIFSVRALPRIREAWRTSNHASAFPWSDTFVRIAWAEAEEKL